MGKGTDKLFVLVFIKERKVIFIEIFKRDGFVRAPSFLQFDRVPLFIFQYVVFLFFYFLQVPYL